jgi:hypothetical protein
MNPGDVDQAQNDALAAYRAAAHAEADAYFDERALETQRHKILARLAHLGETARVIRFPRSSPGAQPAGTVNRRWISVAAAAGLIVGLLGGQLVHLAPRTSTRPVASASAMAEAPRPAIPSIVPATANIDDDLFAEVDFAIELLSAGELRALDELTPLHEQQR